MPLYDFECQDCGRRFEDLVFEDDEENPVCPKCGSTNTLRLISEPSPMLKNAPPFKVGPVNQVFLNRIKQAEAGIAPPCGGNCASCHQGSAPAALRIQRADSARLFRGERPRAGESQTTAMLRFPPRGEKSSFRRDRADSAGL